VSAAAKRATGDRRCPQCMAWRPTADFRRRNGDGLVRWCIGCRDRYRNWDALTRDERLARKAAPSPRLGDGYTVTLNLRSHNRKLGPIPSTMTDRASCPPSCTFMGRGCYAETNLLGWHFRRVAMVGMGWLEFCSAVRRFRRGMFWRHNVAGDLPGKGEALDIHALALLVDANRGRLGFTFTHKPLRTAAEREIVRAANEAGFTINLSADSLEDADSKLALGIAPVAVVLPNGTVRSLRTPAGHKVVVCPAVTAHLTCDACRLCAKPQRKAIIGFPAHGVSKNIVSELVRERRPS